MERIIFAYKLQITFLLSLKAVVITTVRIYEMYIILQIQTVKVQVFPITRFLSKATRKLTFCGRNSFHRIVSVTSLIDIYTSQMEEITDEILLIIYFG